MAQILCQEIFEKPPPQRAGAGFDYYPFGMVMPGRSYSAGSQYRYGFNGKENDNDVKGEGNQQDYGMRIYDPRLGRFLSVDPLTMDFPWYTPYQFAGNTPVQAVDIDGSEPKGYNFNHPYVASHSGTGVKFIPSNYDGKVYEHTKLGLVTAYAIQDIDKKCYLIFQSATGARKQYWYREYDKGGWKGNVNSFVWQTPPDPSNLLTAITVAPLIALPSLITALFATGTVSLSTIFTNLATKGVMYYWRWAPLIGTAGRTAAEFLDESGSVVKPSAKMLAKLTHEETVVVKTLEDIGRKIQILPENKIYKMADFVVDGVKTELKTLTSDTFNANTAVTRIMEAFQQGQNVILDARKYSNVTKEQVQSIYDRVSGSMKAAKKEIGSVEIWTQDGIYKY